MREALERLRRLGGRSWSSTTAHRGDDAGARGAQASIPTIVPVLAKLTEMIEPLHASVSELRGARGRWRT